MASRPMYFTIGLMFMVCSGGVASELRYTENVASERRGAVPVYRDSAYFFPPSTEQTGYPQLFLQKMTYLLSDAIHSLEQTQNVKEKQWLESYIQRLGHLAADLKSQTRNLASFNFPSNIRENYVKHKTNEIPGHNNAVYRQQNDVIALTTKSPLVSKLNSQKENPLFLHLYGSVPRPESISPPNYGNPTPAHGKSPPSTTTVDSLSVGSRVKASTQEQEVLQKLRSEMLKLKHGDDVDRVAVKKEKPRMKAIKEPPKNSAQNYFEIEVENEDEGEGEGAATGKLEDNDEKEDTTAIITMM